MDGEAAAVPCQGCGVPVEMPDPLVHSLTRDGRGRVVRVVSAWCPACAAELDERMRREFPNIFGGES